MAPGAGTDGQFITFAVVFDIRRMQLGLNRRLRRNGIRSREPNRRPRSHHHADLKLDVAFDITFAVIMQIDRIFGHAFPQVVGRQFFILDNDQIASFYSDLDAVRRNGCDGFPLVTHFVMRNRQFRSGNRENAVTFVCFTARMTA